MSENKKLLLGVGIIFGVACLLVIGVYAQERVGFVEHFVHIGVDKETLDKEMDAADRREAKAKESERNANEWAKEVESFWSSQDQ